MNEKRPNACIFISYASEQRGIAESISLALLNLGLKVFFDRDSLTAGRDYNKEILNRIRESDLFLFLISPESVRPGRYTLTELKYAREVWSSPSGHVLPVMVAKTAYEEIPQYLKSVAVFENEGNLAAEISTKVNDLISSWDADELVINQKKNVRILQLQQELNDIAADARRRFNGGDPPTTHLSLKQDLRIKKGWLFGFVLMFLVPAAYSIYIRDAGAANFYSIMGIITTWVGILALRRYAAKASAYIDAREQIKRKFSDCIE